MGSTGIIADQVHSFNLENMHYEFTANLMRKQEMDFVVALGDGLKSFYMMIEPKRFAGYDQRRAKILAELIEDPKKLDVLKNRFAVQYALTNPNLLASTGNKKISETIVEENGSKYGTRKDRLSTGETVFYDLKINNDLGV